jgi:hypothetical protein
MPEEGEFADKAVAHEMLKSISNFWKAARGELPGVRTGAIKKGK